MWDEELCIQCGKCVLVCPHSVIRAKNLRWRAAGIRAARIQVGQAALAGIRFAALHAAGGAGGLHRLHAVRGNLPGEEQERGEAQGHQHDAAAALRETESRNWEFFASLPEPPRERLSHGQVKDVQLLEPLFEFSGACAGCGETPYIKLLTQLFGDRLMIANATGCSSIYGGNLPTTPYTKNAEGRGPAWSNSLFEDNAEFGLGMRLASDHKDAYARYLVQQLSGSHRRGTGERNSRRAAERAKRESWRSENAWRG